MALSTEAKWVIGLGTGLGVLVLAGRSGAMARRRGDPRGPQVPAVLQPHFPAGQRRQYLRWLLGKLAELGITGEAAILFAALLVSESGYGTAIYNYNFGNVHEYGSDPWYRTGADGNAAFSAFGSDIEGLRYLWNLIHHGRYTDAGRMLDAGDVGFYRELGLAGYYGSGTLDRTDPHRIAIADAGGRRFPSIVASVRSLAA